MQNWNNVFFVGVGWGGGKEIINEQLETNIVWFCDKTKSKHLTNACKVVNTLTGASPMF